MDEIKNVFGHVINLMEQDNRGVQLGCYSVALIGLSVAIRRVRPFSRFRKPKDIPDRFIKERKELTGLVESIDPNGALLMVRHKPLLTLPGLPGGHLPVKISGVTVSGLGLSWLQAVVTGHEVKFIPLAKGRDFVQCQVLLPKNEKNKQKFINLGESLVKVGFGNVADIEKPISTDRNFLMYYNRLQVAENYARRKELGVKYYIRPVSAFVTDIVKSFNSMLYATYRHIIQIPKMPIS